MIYVLIALAIILFYLFSFYNRLRRFQVHIKASIQEIGNQLKRQANLIPNLIDSAKGYMKHEKSIFKDLTDARKTIDEAVESNNPEKIDQAQKLIGKTIDSIKIIMESNPEIKSSELVNNLMNELRDTADKLMYSRRTLIDLSADYNTTIVTIPGAWIAPIFGFKQEKGLSTPTDNDQITVTKEDMKSPKVNL